MALPPLEARITADTSDYDAGFDKAQAKLGGLETGFRRAGSQANTLGRSLDGASGSTANLAAQFNDIGVMLAAGQSPLLLAVQQGTQVNQVLGQMGGTGRQRLAALGTAFMSIVSPANLLTLGIIAGGAALVQWGVAAIGAADDGNDFASAMEEIDRISAGLKSTQDILAMSVDELREKYGRYSDAILTAARSLAVLQAAEARARLGETVGDLDGLIGRYAEAAEGARRASGTTAAALQRIQDDLGVTQEQAALLQSAFTQLDTATTFDQQAEALTRVNELLTDAGIDAAVIPEELRAALIEVNSLTIAMADLAVQTENTAAAARGMTTGFGLSPNDPNLLPPARSGDNKPTRSGGGARVNPLIGQVEQLQESLMTQEELQFASYQKQQDMLSSALEQQLITRQEYADLMEQVSKQHADKLSQIDAYRHGTTLQQTDQFLGDMAQAFASGNDQMLRVARAFGAAQALIGALTGAAEALKLPFPANLAAAAKVLATGMGFVSAIKGVTAGGGGAGGAASGGAAGIGGGGGAALGAAAAAPIPLQVNAQFQGDYFTRAQVSQGVAGLFDQLSDEAQRRGLNLTVVA